MSETPACSWCNQLFRARHGGGRGQRFCRPSCRRAFHAAARSWALDAIASGALTVADIKSGSAATRALRLSEEAPCPTARSRSVFLSLKVLPNVIEEVGRVGWLTSITRLDDAVGAAVAELVERSIALGLRPGQ
jgi:hypothetical protein